MIKVLTIVCVLIFVNSYCQTGSEQNIEKKIKQEDIIKQYIEQGAKNYSIYSKEWQDNINEGLKKDSTIAYLWQQKAMPYFKLRKYEIGMPLINKAVNYDREEWQPYRAFIKCIFAKTYTDAILDFEDCKSRFGNNYVMDHTYDFYVGLCFLQLNEYEKAEQKFKIYSEEIFKNRECLEHPTVLFYNGIALYEQQKWKEAIVMFDKALNIYSNFSDVKFYKAICLLKLNRSEEAKKLFKEGKNDADNGYTINEDNTIYEKYPYQVLWR